MDDARFGRAKPESNVELFKKAISQIAKRRQIKKYCHKKRLCIGNARIRPAVGMAARLPA
jgi:hypothetical protein